MKKIYFILLLAISVSTTFAQTVIAKWTFEGVTFSGVAGTTPNITVGSAAADVGAQTAGSVFTGSHASASTVWSTVAGNGSAKSSSSNNWAINDYYQFQVNTTGYSGISVTFDQTGSNTGPSGFKLQYSTDGTTFTDFASYTIPSNGAAAFSWSSGAAITQTTMSFNLSSVVALNNAPAVYLRLTDNSTVAFNGAAVATAGTNRVDNFAVTLSPSLTAANNGTQPLPGTIAQSSTKNVLQTFSITEGGVAANTLTQVKVPMSGTYIAADIANFKLYANSVNDISTATSIKSVSSGAAGSGEMVYFNGLAYALALNSTNYFWVTVDATATANTARTINASALNGNNFTFVIGPASGVVSAGGSQIFTAPLPVSIEYLKGSKQGSTNFLTWKSGCQTTSATFELQRSTDLRNFTIINQITASQARCAQPFDFSDNSPAAGTIYYRLKKTEIDGNFSYSIIVAVINKEKGFEFVGLYPTVISNDAAVLNVSAAVKTILEIVVTDIDGRVMQKQTATIEAGSNAININVSKLAPGSYHLSGYTTNGINRTIPFVKQ